MRRDATATVRKKEEYEDVLKRLPEVERNLFRTIAEFLERHYEQTGDAVEIQVKVPPSSTMESATLCYCFENGVYRWHACPCPKMTRKTVP
jgi:hypothetical protein